ncbi:hypothetical protein ABIE44_001188 [Marmoricola sp. OAE513]|uniref:DUF4129 domain-containing protein n=1 Tax=Marmoricola sp. OAE513 TaxID=2817894 RepID=UPI001AE132DA
MTHVDNVLGAAAYVPWGAPLDPSPDGARTSLRRELLRPEYHQDNPLQQVLRWLQDRIGSGLDAASNTSPIGAAGALVVFLVVLGLLGWFLSRFRRSSQAVATSGAVLTEERVTAAELRSRAVAAMAENRYEDAVTDGFRALALRQIEHGRLDEQPGATAHEVAVQLGNEFAGTRDRIFDAAGLFDLVLYGDRAATREQAESVLALDDDLVGVR